MNFMPGSEFRKHVDGNRELIYTAYHEAGHVVAARHFGFRVAWVSIDPDFYNYDPLALKHCLTGPGVLGTSMVMASERLTFLVPHGIAKNSRERRMLLEFCVEVLCGPVAEALVNPDYWQTAAGDEWIIERALQAFGSRCLRHLNKRKREVERAADRFIDQHGETISRFAERLLMEGTIREAEIDSAISWAKSTPLTSV
jgi:hypothetical protein